MPYMYQRRDRKPTLSYMPPEQSPRWAWWRQRGFVTALAVLLWLVLVSIYAVPGTSQAWVTLLMEGGVALIWLASCAGLGAIMIRLTRAMNPEDGGALRFVISAALGIGLLSLVVLLLGLVGVLHQLVAIALLCPGLIYGAVRVLKPGPQFAPHGAWASQRAGWAWLLLLILPFIAIMIVGAILPPGLLWTPDEPHGYDVVEYHLQIPREWYELGRIAPLHHNVFSYLPFNVEMHYLLAMHLRGGPWRGMYVAQLMHALMILLTVLAACAFAFQLAPATKPLSKRFAPVAAGIAILSTPWIPQLGAIAYVEGGLLLYATLAIGFALRGLLNPDRSLRSFALAGVLSGLACGCKLTAIPQLLLPITVVSLLLVLILPSFKAQPLLHRLRGPLLHLALGSLVVSPWLIRTWAWAGNPIFPEMTNVLGHAHWSPEQAERWRISQQPRPDQRSISGRLSALWNEVEGNWQYGFVLMPLALVAIVLRRSDPATWFLGALLFLLAPFWAGFTHLQSRFFILSVPLAALLITRLPWQVGILIVLQPLIAFPMLHRHFESHVELRGNGAEARVTDLTGVEDLSWMDPAPLGQVPADGQLVLVGDARAFLFQRPMSRLKYRTIFDVDASQDKGIIEAWAGPKPPGEQWLLIDPNELQRFGKTYYAIPPVPAEIRAHPLDYVVRR